jgi:hypothetical protein
MLPKLGEAAWLILGNAGVSNKASKQTWPRSFLGMAILICFGVQQGIAALVFFGFGKRKYQSCDPSPHSKTVLLRKL